MIWRTNADGFAVYGDTMTIDSKNQHTPGPWKLTHDRPMFITAPNPDGAKYRDRIVAQMASNHLESTVANGLLIAAAPEMLEVLRDLVFRIDFAKTDGTLHIPLPVDGEGWTAAARALLARLETR